MPCCMSTVTESKPHWAITSAEKPEGIASQPLMTAFPDAQIFATLFAIGRILPETAGGHARRAAAWGQFRGGSMYQGPIIDAHHHLWDLALGRHRWLIDPAVGIGALGDISFMRH